MPSYKDWYHWEWKHGIDQPADHFDTWHFKPRTTEWQDMNFKEAIRDALIKLQEPKLPLYIMYSGGLDSEVILYEAILAGIPIIPVTIRFKDGLNNNDLAYVEDFKTKFGIEVMYLDIDIMEWLADDKTEYGYATQVRDRGFFHMATPLYFWARDQLNALVGPCVCINGSGDLPLAKVPDLTNISKVSWYVCASIDSQWKRLNWSNTHYQHDAPLFFMYTPELVGSFLHEAEIRNCVSVPYKLSVSSSKKALYYRLWPELQSRPKYTGFEAINIDVETVMKQVRLVENPITIYSQISYAEFVKLFEHRSD